MQQFPIHIAMNVWAILTAGVAKFLLGWLWYAPFSFRQSLAAVDRMHSGGDEGQIAEGHSR
ncbi:MAG: hypothetical protein ABJB97_06505 [Acidobacteriota bacterium]